MSLPFSAEDLGRRTSELHFVLGSVHVLQSHADARVQLITRHVRAAELEKAAAQSREVSRLLSLACELAHVSSSIARETRAALVSPSASALHEKDPVRAHDWRYVLANANDMLRQIEALPVQLSRNVETFIETLQGPLRRVAPFNEIQATFEALMRRLMRD